MQYTVKATAYAISYNNRENNITRALEYEFTHPQEFYYNHDYAVLRRQKHVIDILTHYGFGHVEALKALMPFIEKIPDEKSSWLS